MQLPEGYKMIVVLKYFCDGICIQDTSICTLKSTLSCSVSFSDGINVITVKQWIFFIFITAGCRHQCLVSEFNTALQLANSSGSLK